MDVTEISFEHTNQPAIKVQLPQAGAEQVGRQYRISNGRVWFVCTCIRTGEKSFEWVVAQEQRAETIPLPDLTK